MPLRLLWQPRNPREVDVPMVLDIIDYDTRWDKDAAETRWQAGDADRRWTHLPVFARWIILETRRFVWKRDRTRRD